MYFKKILFYCFMIHCASAKENLVVTNGNVQYFNTNWNRLSPKEAVAQSSASANFFPSLDDDDSGENETDFEAKASEVRLKKMNRTKLFCEPEAFHHSYVTAGGKREPMTNAWKRAKAGQRVGLHEVCLKPNGIPLTRKCLLNILPHHEVNASWENISDWKHVECLRETRENIISVKLNTLHDEIIEGKHLGRGVQGRREVTNMICDILNQTDYKLLPADVHFTSQLLNSVATEAKDRELSPEVVNICDTLMSSDPNILRMSASLNATNALLETFETYMDDLSDSMVPSSRCGIPLNVALGTNTTAPNHHTKVETIDFAHIGVQIYFSSNISVFYVNPLCANITGIALYHPGTTRTSYELLRETHGKFLYRFVHMNESAISVMQETGLQVATFVPQSLWQHFQSVLSASAKLPLVVFKVYAHDALFVEQSTMQAYKPFSQILSISVPGYESQLPEVLPFMLSNRHTTSSLPSIGASTNRCGYWNYKTWTYDGVQIQSIASQDGSVVLCGTTHLTQFSFLLGGSYKQSDLNGNVLITPAHEQTLDIISLVGCSLSLVGLLGIWLTAILFKSWRSLSSTKVLLHMCLALTLEMVLFVFVNTDGMSEHLVKERSYASCIALGALTQYSILVLFSWMLIVAFLQFQRYVTIIGIERPRHYILKSAIAAWGFPLIPTILVACIDPESYIPSAYQLRTNIGICYPSGHGLMFGVVLPVTLIVIANLIIFVHVFYSISHSLGQSLHRQEKKMLIKQIRLSVLLFFLLGLSWIFGIFAFMQFGIAFSYLFCLTATLQGFVLFVYFVILDGVPRKEWAKLLCPSQKSEKKATEMQSITTTSGGLENGEVHK